MSEHSVNIDAENIVGKREEYLTENAIILDRPCELGYRCPVCKYKNPVGGYDERLDWSEYRSFIWCRVCDKDYPSVLCQPNIDKAIETYLVSIKEAVNRATTSNREETDNG